MTYIYGQEKPSLDTITHHGIKGQKWGVRRAAKRNLTSVSREVNVRQQNARFNSTISEQQYRNLSSKDVVIKKGSTLSRISETPNEDARKNLLYVSTNRADALVYRGVLPAGKTKGMTARKHEGYYETTLQATSDLKSPSEKERVDAYKRIMSQRQIKLDGGEIINGREYLKRQGLGNLVDSHTDKQLALMYYGQLAGQQGIRNEPLSSAYFKSLKKKGYNALIDDNDRNILAKEPLLILDSTRTLKPIHVKKLTTKDVHIAQATLKIP